MKTLKSNYSFCNQQEAENEHNNELIHGITDRLIEKYKPNRGLATKKSLESNQVQKNAV